MLWLVGECQGFTVADTEPSVNRFRGSKFESFGSLDEAEKWLMRELKHVV